MLSLVCRISTHNHVPFVFCHLSRRVNPPNSRQKQIVVIYDLGKHNLKECTSTVIKSLTVDNINKKDEEYEKLQFLNFISKIRCRFLGSYH